MPNWLLPSKPPTPSEWAVLFWTFVILLILAGISGLVISLALPPESHELAVEAARYGVRALGAGVVIGGGVWLVRRFLD